MAMQGDLSSHYPRTPAQLKNEERTLERKEAIKLDHNMYKVDPAVLMYAGRL